VRRNSRVCRRGVSSEETVKDDGLKVGYTCEDWVVGDEGCRPGVDGGRGLNGIGCLQSMVRTDLGSTNGNFEIGGDPFEVGKRRKHPEEFVGADCVLVAVRMNEEFGQRNRRRQRNEMRLLQGGENVIREGRITRVGLPLIDENAGVERDAPVRAKEGAELC